MSLDLEALVDAWRGPLVGWIRARGVREPEASELARDVLSEAWLGRHRLRADPSDERAVGAWLRGIARNLVLAHERSRGRRPAASEDDAAEPPASADAEASDEARRLRRAVDALPLREREAVRAFYLEETSTARVAALLGTTERAVEGLLRRARTRLAEILARSETPHAPR